MSVVIKPGQIWRRKTDGTLVEVLRVELTFKQGFASRSDVAYRRVEKVGAGTSQCYADNFPTRYDLVEEVES